MVTIVLLIACVVGLFTVSPWVFIAIALLLLHPLAFFLAGAVVGAGVVVLVNRWAGTPPRGSANCRSRLRAARHRRLIPDEARRRAMTNEAALMPGSLATPSMRRGDASHHRRWLKGGKGGKGGGAASACGGNKQPRLQAPCRHHLHRLHHLWVHRPWRITRSTALLPSRPRWIACHDHTHVRGCVLQVRRQAAQRPMVRLCRSARWLVGRQHKATESQADTSPAPAQDRCSSPG